MFTWSGVYHGKQILKSWCFYTFVIAPDVKGRKLSLIRLEVGMRMCMESLWKPLQALLKVYHILMMMQWHLTNGYLRSQLTGVRQI